MRDKTLSSNNDAIGHTPGMMMMVCSAATTYMLVACSRADRPQQVTWYISLLSRDRHRRFVLNEMVVDASRSEWW